jgi:hypothetical protein
MGFSMTNARLALSILVALGALLPRTAVAAEWVEPKFDPPLGSKWIIERQIDVEKNSGGTIVGHTQKDKALLTFVSKSDAGYVVTFTRQESSYEGNPSDAAHQRIAYQALQGLVMRIDTDLTGKPVRIENWDEVKAALKSAANSEPLTTANPEILAKVHELVDRSLKLDDKQAAELYVDDLRTLALAQRTGLKQQGEIHKSVVPVVNALSNGISKTVMLSLSEADPATGKARYLMTETYDPDSVRALVSETVKEFSTTNVSASMIDQAIKSAVVSAVTRAQFNVEGGMTRELREESFLSFRPAGSISVDTESKLVTVRPAE